MQPGDTEFSTSEGMLRATELDSLNPGDSELLRIYATDPVLGTGAEEVDEEDVKRKWS